MKCVRLELASIIVIILFICGCKDTPKQSVDGTVKITSNISGVKLYCDGEYIDLISGKSKSIPFKAGAYKLSFRRDGYQDRVEKVRVRLGKTMHISLHLKTLTSLQKTKKNSKSQQEVRHKKANTGIKKVAGSVMPKITKAQLLALLPRKVGRVVFPTGKPSVYGGLDRGIIQRIINKNRPHFKSCYESGLLKNQRLQGKIHVWFQIEANGQVNKSRVSRTTMNNDKVEQCLVQRVRQMRFPKPRGGGVVIVNYPFISRPK